MGLLIANGEIEYVSVESVHRMTYDQAVAFIHFAEAERRRHEKDIEQIDDIIKVVKEAHPRTFKKGTCQTETGKQGYYRHSVVRNTILS